MDFNPDWKEVTKKPRPKEKDDIGYVIKLMDNLHGLIDKIIEKSPMLTELSSGDKEALINAVYDRTEHNVLKNREHIYELTRSGYIKNSLNDLRKSTRNNTTVPKSEEERRIRVARQANFEKANEIIKKGGIDRKAFVELMREYRQKGIEADTIIETLNQVFTIEYERVVKQAVVHEKSMENIKKGYLH